MKTKYWIAFAAALSGLAAAYVERKISVDWWVVLDQPFRLLGRGLRTLSLSGFWGNAASWLLTALLCALPMLLLCKGERGREDWLVAGMVPVLFAMVYYSVNPTQLNELTRIIFPLAALCTALAMLLCWYILRALRRLEALPAQQLAKAFSLLLAVCAVLMAFAAAYGPMRELLAWGSDIVAGSGPISRSRHLTGVMLTVVTGLKVGRDVLTAWTLLLGARLAEKLGDLRFDEETVALCGETAKKCVWVVKRSMFICVGLNLAQLVLLDQLQQSSFNLELPLFTLALSAALFLLCRCLQRGRELQDDSESII